MKKLVQDILVQEFFTQRKKKHFLFFFAISTVFINSKRGAMSELKSELDEMEPSNYSMNSNIAIDPKNNEELIIYVRIKKFFCFY